MDHIYRFRSAIPLEICGLLIPISESRFFCYLAKSRCFFPAASRRLALGLAA